MDLTGVEPAPAPLTERRGAITPQAHSRKPTQDYERSHGHWSHTNLWIPESVLASIKIAQTTVGCALS